MAAIDTKRNIRRVLFNGNVIQLIGEGCTVNKLPQVLNKTVVELTALDLDGITSTPGGWQSGNTHLEKVELPEGLITIGGGSFQDCTRLKELILPYGLQNLCNGSQFPFRKTALTSLVIPETVETIKSGSWFFSDMYELKELIFLRTRQRTRLEGGTRNFQTLTKLITLTGVDVRSITDVSYGWNNTWPLTNLFIYSINYGLKATMPGLTVESLINTAQQLIDKTGGTSQTLSLGATNIAKIADVYVKPITTITEEMIAEDDLIESKLPCEVCESTDEGAMLLEDYIYLKNWKLA